MAQDRIARAEPRPWPRSARWPPDAATAAAGALIAARLDDAKAAALIDAGIGDLGSKLN